MKKRRIYALFLLTSSISSCFCNEDCTVKGYHTNCWHDFNNSEYNYYKIKLNLSTYFEEDYIVFGAALGKEYKIRITKQFKTIIDDSVFDKISFYDSTGAEVHFDENNNYYFNSSRTIKIDYSKLNDSEKEEIETKHSFYFNGKYFSLNDKMISEEKVQFGDTLVYDDIK